MISSYVSLSLGGLRKEYVMDHPKFSKFKTPYGLASDTEEIIFGAPTHSTIAYSLGNMRVNNNEFYYPTPPGSVPSSGNRVAG